VKARSAGRGRLRPRFLPAGGERNRGRSRARPFHELALSFAWQGARRNLCPDLCRVPLSGSFVGFLCRLFHECASFLRLHRASIKAGRASEHDTFSRPRNPTKVPTKETTKETTKEPDKGPDCANPPGQDERLAFGRQGPSFWNSWHYLPPMRKPLPSSLPAPSGSR